MKFVKLSLALGVSALFSASATFGAVVYTQTSGTGLTTSTASVPFVLDDVNFAAGSTLTSPQQLSAITFALAVLPSTAAQSAVVFLDFYDTVNNAATGAVTSSYLGGFGGTLTITANTSTTTAALRAFTFSSLTTLATPINFADDNIGVVLTLANAAGTAYSTVLTPVTSVPGAPTVGTSVAGVYRDTNNNGTFEATEFNAALGNEYFSITTVNAVPEPSALALGGLGLAGCVAVVLRRRRATV